MQLLPKIKPEDNSDRPGTAEEARGRMLSAQRRGKRPREFQPEPGGRLQPKRAFQLARGRKSSSAGWPLGSVYPLGPGLTLGTVPPELSWGLWSPGTWSGWGLRAKRPWERTTQRMGATGPTREEPREGVQAHGNCLGQKQAGSRAELRAVTPGGSAAEGKASVHLLTGTFLHSPTQSLSHSAKS